MRFRKKPVVVEATQWFKHGDHPAVSSLSGVSKKCDFRCPKCGDAWGKHGAIQTLETREGGEHVVCPRDWIITGVKGEHYACKPDIFAATYEPAKDHGLDSDYPETKPLHESEGC